MKYIYKTIKTKVPHCPNCKVELRGNNSYINPYRCKCGIWESNWRNPVEYKIIPFISIKDASKVLDQVRKDLEIED